MKKKPSKKNTRKPAGRRAALAGTTGSAPLKEETIRRIVNKMPGGLDAFCIQWGWLTFARRIERAHGIR